jgi:hypothetical protein
MKVRLRQNDKRRGTDKAHVFTRIDNQMDIWIPRILVSHVSRDMPDEHGWRFCTVEVEDWFAEKNNL